MRIFDALRIALLVPIVGVWGCHLYQRKFPEETGGRKRMATFALTIVLLGLWGAVWLFASVHLDWVFAIPVVFLAAGITYAWRKTLFPYRLTCVKCGARLPVKVVLFVDSNTCPACMGQLTQKGDES